MEGKNNQFIFFTEKERGQFEKAKTLLEDYSYLVTLWEAWGINLVLDKKALDYGNFHYVQHENLAKLIENRGVNLRHIAFGIPEKPLFRKKDDLNVVRLQHIAERLEADIVPLGEVNFRILGKYSFYTLKK